MTSSNFPKTILLIGISILIYACQTSKAVSFNQDDNDVYLAQKSSMPKGAVRLTIQLRSDLMSGDGEHYAEAEVLEVHMYGGTFASAKPKKGDVVRLSIVGGIEGREFKNGDKVKLDALTPVLKEGDMLDISML